MFGINVGSPAMKELPQVKSSRPTKRRRSPRSRKGRDDRSQSPPPSPDAAFRSSLFEALASDEAAAYWQGVYGHPIHIYSRWRPKFTGDSSHEGPDGEPLMERMSDDEYVDFVRTKLWEKSNEFISMGRARRDHDREEERERAKKKAKVREARKKREEELDLLDSLLDERMALARKKDASWWKQRWETYLSGWEELKKMAEEIKLLGKEPANLSIPWPVASGAAQDIEIAPVEEFFRKGSAASGSGNDESTLITALKTERVRWHPDKFQYMLKGVPTDEATIRSVTAVFQIIDKLWTDLCRA